MKRVLSCLFPRGSMPPRPQRLPAADVRPWTFLGPEGDQRGQSKDEAARADLALRLLGNVTPTDRALAGWAGWMRGYGC